MNKNQIRRTWEYLRRQTPMVAAVGALALLASGCNDKKNIDRVDVGNVPVTKAVDATIPPSEKYDAKYWNTVVCSKGKATIKEGDTLFGITTQGLHKDKNFMNQVFAWNLDNVKKAGKNRPALSDPDAIPVGTRFSIMTDCVKLGAAVPEYDTHNISPSGMVGITGYTRDAAYQNFTGTDGLVRHMVTVRYHSNAVGDFYDPSTDEPFKPEACSPSPECYQYIPDAPKAIPADAYLP